MTNVTEITKAKKEHKEPEGITQDNQIETYIHCGRCLKELPVGMSPMEYSMAQSGFTEFGIQIWCHRHNCNVVNIDFEGQVHPST
jgi:hypothetical protein